MAEDSRPDAHCKYCFHKRGICGEKSKDGRFTCTRQHNHKGRHIACGISTHELVRWNRKSAN